MVNSTAITTETLADALQPGGALSRDYDAVWQTLWRQNHIPPTLLELCRLRLAQLHGAQAELEQTRDVGLEAEKAAALRAGTWLDDARFGAAELAALEFTEIYAQDPAAIGDEQADAVKRHFGEAGLVCLVEALGFIDGRIRLALMFNALRAH